MKKIESFIFSDIEIYLLTTYEVWHHGDPIRHPAAIQGRNGKKVQETKGSAFRRNAERPTVFFVPMCMR